jgi:HEAT repeat protein
MLEPPAKPVRKLPQKEIDKIKADIEELGSADMETAERAKSRLGRRRGQVVEFLAEATASPSIVVRHLALHTLERIGDPRTFPIFVDMAHEQMPDMRWCALEALGKVGRERAIPYLIDVLKNADEGSTEHEGAYRGIVAIGEPAVPAVLELLKNGERSWAPHLLAWIGSEAAFEPLSEMLDDPDPDIRIEGVELLARMAEDHPEKLGSRCLALIERALEDTEEKVRNNATYWCNEIHTALGG